MLIQVNGHDVFYATGGIASDQGKPTLVFVHGAAMDHSVWTLFSRFFSRHGSNVIAFDLPGHGRSSGAPISTIEGMADWLWQALDVLGIELATLAGHSMGSLVVLQAAARAPSRTSALALLGFSYPMAVGAPLLEAAERNSHDAIDMLMIWGHDQLAQIGGNSIPGMGIITPIQRIVERAAPGVLHNDLYACHTYTHGVEAAAEVQCPVTLILGDRDRMTPLKAARAFAKNFKQVEIEILRECGHGMLEERPEETYRALAGVLTRV